MCFYLVIIVNNMVDELKENVGKCYEFFFVFFWFIKLYMLKINIGFGNI